MGITGTRQKGFAHIFAFLGLALVIIIAFILWRINKVTESTSTSDYKFLTGESYEISKFEKNGLTLVYPSGWGSFISEDSDTVEKGVVAEDYVDKAIFKGYFNNLGENNKLELYTGGSVIGRTKINEASGCDVLDTENQKYYELGSEIHESYPKCKLFGYEDASPSERIVNPINSSRLLFIRKGNAGSVGSFAPKKGIRYDLSINPKETDLIEGNNDCCGSMYKMYKGEAEDRLYNVYIDVASVLIELNK